MEFYLFIAIFTLTISKTSIVCAPMAVDPYTQAAYRPRLDIYKRRTSDFNRLQSNRIDFSSYDSLNDRPPTNENKYDQRTTTRQPYNQQNSINDFNSPSLSSNQVEDRRFQKKRPCVPVYPHKLHRSNQQQGNSRTLYDLNFYFLGYQPNKYDYDGSTGPVNSVSQAGSPNPEYNAYGGYYDCTPNPFFKPPFGAFGSGLGGLNDDPNRPSPFGLFGQGLYDFFNGLLGYGGGGGGAGGGGGGSGFGGGGSGGYDSPIGAGSVLDDNSNRPVFEINVPDVIQALNPNNWRPGQLVGGIQNSVNGFVQGITRYIPF